MGLRVFLIAFAAATIAAAAPAAPLEGARGDLLRRVERLEAEKRAGVAGRDGWFFSTSELRAYGVGQFWGEHAAAVSRAPKDQDPLVTLVAFHEMLRAAGISLILVPVPGKVVLLPDELDPPLKVDGRLDAAHAEFYDRLRKAGIEVVDLYDAFRSLRGAGTPPYCKQDTHWSPQGLRRAAASIAALIRDERWYADARKGAATMTPLAVEARGDIVGTLLKDPSAAPERLTLDQVRIDGQWVDTDTKSPVVLMGDSHTLVFHRPDLLGEHAGLSDHLAAELGFPVDLVGVMAGGANASRMVLARRRDNLAGKKVVVWVFRASEFSETDEGWRAIPVIR